MIVAAALTAGNSRAGISDHFGRCEWFGLYNTKTKLAQYISNPNQQSVSNAGMLSADLMMAHKVTLVIAGRFGFKVAEKFKANNIQMIIPQDKQSWSDFIKLLKKQQ